jgi:integrase
MLTAPEPSAPDEPPNGPQLLAEHDAFVASLPCNTQAKNLRLQGARKLLADVPDLRAWMKRPTQDRLSVVRRTGGWPFLSWCFATGRLRPDLELLACKGKGGHYATWVALHPADAQAVQDCATGLGWCPEYVHRVAENALPLVCLTSVIGLREIDQAALDAVPAAIDRSHLLAAATRKHLRAEHYALSNVCFQLGLIEQQEQHPNRRSVGLAQRIEAVPQPAIRAVMLRYLTVIGTTQRPKTVTEKAAAFVVFTQWLNNAVPDVRSLTELTRPHLEAFLAYHRYRPTRGRAAASGRSVSLVRHIGAVVALRGFFDDIAVWGWPQRPDRPVLHRSDIPRQPVPLPRALPAAADQALMTAVAGLDDIAARTAIVLLRGTGMRLGELMDLELNCLWDLPRHGTWIKVPLGKLNTERVVPLDDATLAAIDAWVAVRGPQRPLPHPRDHRPTDFLFTIAGHRMGTQRVRRGLDVAATAAGLTTPDGHPIRVTPHMLRHTYATTLINAGMSLQALMALLGHVTPHMTLRYAQLANSTVRAAYDAALGRLSRRELPLVIAGRPTVPDRIEWLRSEMLKTRVAHGYCSRHLAAEACPYANICEQCDNFVTTTEFAPALQAQLQDELALAQDAEERGWDTEVARHARVIASIKTHLTQLDRSGTPQLTPTPTAG